MTEQGPRIGLIGCGFISGVHLEAYHRDGLDVAWLCDVDEARAAARRDEFFPHARVTSSAAEVFDDPGVTVVDVATHVDIRPGIVEAALTAGKHVLSQKPFVLDLDQGERLCRLADDAGLLLASNQNGRWAPHFRRLLDLAEDGSLGRLGAADFGVYWGHDLWVADKPHFATMHDLVLYDFGIHWFDLVATLFADRGPATVSAMIGRREGQVIDVPTQAQVLIDYPDAQVSLAFRGSSRTLDQGWFRVDGQTASLTHAGAPLGGDQLTLQTSSGTSVLPLAGEWFPDGMAGTMGELLAGLREGRPPSNSARSALEGLALCFAAIESARTREMVAVGAVRTLPR